MPNVEARLGPSEADITGAEIVRQKSVYRPRGRDRFNPRLAFILAGALGLSSLVMACTPEAKAEPPSSPKTQAIPVTIIIKTPTPEAPPIPTATAVPTETPTPNPTATATAVAGGKIPPEGTQIPKTEAPKGFDCGILSPEACANAEYIQWNRPDGQPVEGIGFILKAGEKIKIPKNLVVAGSEFPKPHTFNGFSINALSRDGKTRVLYIGNITPVNITNVGEDLPAGTVVGTIADSGSPVFQEAPYNLIVRFSPEDNLKTTFPDQTKIQRRVINNQPVSVTPTSPDTVFFDVKPPPDTVIIPQKKQ